MLIDSHCHLDRIDLGPFAEGFAGMLHSAAQAGIQRMLCVSIRLDHFPALLQMAQDYPAIDCSVGVHPSEREGPEASVAALCRDGAHPHVLAVGETGLDYHYNQGDLEWQRERFRVHIRAARELNKPLIIHSRDARADTLAILRAEKAAEVGGVMHCFTEDWDTAQAALDLGFYISFSGIVTFRSADALREVARRVPLDRLLIETDAPYLAPMPHRGKPNHPALLVHTAACLAKLRGLSIEALSQHTGENYHRCFKAA